MLLSGDGKMERTTRRVVALVARKGPEGWRRSCRPVNGKITIRPQKRRWKITGKRYSTVVQAQGKQGKATAAPQNRTSDELESH